MTISKINSRAPLDRSPNKNWVERSGGLPMYIRRIANHLHQEKGMTIGHAIAVAVNAAKKMCATGDLNWKGKQNVNPKSRAEACAAVASWERKKAGARVSKGGVENLGRKWSDDEFIKHLTGEDVTSEIHKGCGCSHDTRKANKRRLPEEGVGEEVKADLRSKKEKKKKVQKRDVSVGERKKLAEKGKAQPGGRFPIANEKDLKNAIRAIGRSKNPEATKRHIIRQAKKLGLMELIPESWNVNKAHYKEKQGRDHQGKFSNHKVITLEDEEFDSLVEEVENFSSAADSDDPDTVEFLVSGNIEKREDDKQLVFGWASVAKRADGTVVVDKQGDVIEDIDQMEKVAYDFVLHSRDGGEMHVRKGVSTLVESFVSTPEKWTALGIPEGTLPVGWWVGFRVNDKEVWKGVKEGKYKMFSVHGSGTRKAMDG